MSEQTHKQSYRSLSYDFFKTYDVVTNPGNTQTHTRSRSNGISYTYTNSSSGVKRPGWKTIIRNHGNASTEYSYQYLDSRDSICRVEHRHQLITPLQDTQTVQETFNGTLPFSGALGISAPPQSLVDDITNRCIRKFVERCDSVRSSFEAGQDLGEIRQTLEAIIHPMNSLRKHVLSYFSSVEKLRKYRKHRDRLVDALNDSYLEWTFGWNPLASDIAQGIAALQAQGSRFDVVPVRASADGTYGGSVVSSNPVVGTYYILRANSVIVNHYGLRYMGAIRTGAVEGRLPMYQLLQLDLPHFLPTIYDILPYSFIIDYFTNIGDIIKANSFRFADLAWACYTIRQEAKEVFTPTSVSDFTPGLPNKVLYGSTNFSGGPRYASVVQGGRGFLSESQLMPRFTFSVPLSNKPWLNMGSLVTSAALKWARSII